MRVGLIALACVVLLACAAATVAETEIEQQPLQWRDVALGDGEALYGELCAVCHGVDGAGKGPAAEALSMMVPDLTRLTLANDGVFPTKAVEKAIAREGAIAAHGTSEMPIWGRALSEVRPDYKPARREAFARWRISNLATYLETLQVD